MSRYLLNEIFQCRTSLILWNFLKNNRLGLTTRHHAIRIIVDDIDLYLSVLALPYTYIFVYKMYYFFDMIIYDFKIIYSALAAAISFTLKTIDHFIQSNKSIRQHVGLYFIQIQFS